MGGLVRQQGALTPHEVWNNLPQGYHTQEVWDYLEAIQHDQRQLAIVLTNAIQETQQIVLRQGEAIVDIQERLSMIEQRPQVRHVRRVTSSSSSPDIGHNTTLALLFMIFCAALLTLQSLQNAANRGINQRPQMEVSQ